MSSSLNSIWPIIIVYMYLYNMGLLHEQNLCSLQQVELSAD